MPATTIAGAYSTFGNYALSVTFTIDAALSSGAAHTTQNITPINSSVNNQQFWVNYDKTTWQVSGGDAAGGNVVSRYMEMIRSTPTPAGVCWAGISSVVDLTDQQSSQAGGILVHELDMACNGPDNANNRQVLVIVLTKGNSEGAAPEAESAILIHGPEGNAGAFHRPLILDCRFRDCLIDMRTAIHDGGGPGYGIWLGDNHTITWDTAGTFNDAYVSARSRVEHYGKHFFNNEIVLNAITTEGIPVTTSATSGGTTLPSNPVGFLTVNVQGTNRKIPFYNV